METRALAAHFDLNNDAFSELTGWAAPDDGLLVRDINGNGQIDSGSELFGNNTVLPDGTKAANGFLALKALDDNHDGVIDAQDAAYADLRVWRDLNSNGQSEDGELISLAESGVAGISVHATAVNQTLNGNLLTDVSSFTTSQGTQGTVGDIWFKFDQRDTAYDAPSDLDDAIAALPNVLGVGRVKDLHSVMAEDSVLKGMVAELAGFGANDLGKVSALVEAIILRWCGVSDTVATELGRGPYANGAHIAVLEAWNDTPFKQWDIPNPRPYAGATMEDQWDVLARDVAVPGWRNWTTTMTA